MAPPPKVSNKANHKGKRRHFSTPEEIQQQLSNIKINDEENENIEEECSQESNSESDDDIRVTKPKGVSNLIEIENPNRNPQVANNDEVRLSRRQREEIEKAKAKERYFKLAAQGKTEQSKADLARLEVIRKQREEANRKRETEKRSKEVAKGKIVKD